MTTKVSIFGQPSAKSQPTLKPIEFVLSLNEDGSVSSAALKPKMFDNIQKLRTNTSSFDTMMAWDYEEEPIIYLGHWNDGVVG